MKFEKPNNENYAAVVTSVKTVLALEGRDFIVGIPLFGHQAIASKGWEPGDLGVFIPAEAQLSHEYAAANNLYRDTTKNQNPDERGYLEDNRRVRAVKFGGHRSDAMFMPLSSLEFAGVNIGQLQDGDTFDKINGIEIVRKYEVPVKNSGASTKGNQPSKPRRIDKLMFPEHLDTVNFWRNQQLIKPNDTPVVTQKLHGTSIRVGRTLVKRKLTIRERIAKLFGAKILEFEYDNVYGSRKVIKDVNDPDQNHYYKSDIWTEYGRKLDGLIPDGFIVYGELVGWTPSGEPIQKGYTYDVPKGEARLYVYRVAFVNPRGYRVDLGWDQVVEFCQGLGLNHVPVLYEGFIPEEIDVDELIDARLVDDWYDTVPLSDADTVDEGVVFRIEGLTPKLLKAKSPTFLEYETKLLDKGIADLESVGAAA